MVWAPLVLVTASAPWFLKSVAALSLRPSIKHVQSQLICTNWTKVRIDRHGGDEWDVTVDTDQHSYQMQVTELSRQDEVTLTEGTVYKQSQENWETCGTARFIIETSADTRVYGSFSDHETIMELTSSTPSSYQLCAEEHQPTLFYNREEKEQEQEQEQESDNEDSLIDEGESPRWPSQENINESVRSVDTKKCFNTSQIARIGIIADNNYASQFDSSMDAYSNIINVVSKASKIWEGSFNITLSLSELILSSNYTSDSAWDIPCNNTINSVDSLSQRLKTLESWRVATGRDNDGLALWALFTNCPSGDVLGLSIESSACKPSGATVIHHSVLDARVLAHEIGHIFGAVHDCNKDTCGTNEMCCPLSQTHCDSNGTYIMSPGTDPYQNSFSNCSKATICYAIDQQVVNTTCLHQSENASGKIQPLSSLACSKILDPMIRDQCVRNTQCSDMMNTKRTFYCGSLGECSLSCFDPQQQVCAPLGVPLLDGASCRLPLVGTVNSKDSKGLCSLGHCVGQTTPKLWPIWFSVILAGAMFMSALLLLGLASLLYTRFRNRSRRKPQKIQCTTITPCAPPKGAKVNVSEWFSQSK